MKKIVLLLCIAGIMAAVQAQNVGIGENNPAARLTIKGAPLGASLLVKNEDDDSLVLTSYRSLHLGGYHSTAGGVINISNKNFAPIDPVQLNLVANGEFSGGSTNGAMSFLSFSNANTNKTFQLSSYVGADDTRKSFGLVYYDPDDASPIRYLMYMKPTGETGFGTYAPMGRFQINHTSTIASPTLTLYDSSTAASAKLQFRNSGSTGYWQIRGVPNNSFASSYLDFANQGGMQMTLRGDGNLGIGNSNPVEKLEVAGNIRLTGEVTRNATGTANLLPIAYGNVSGTGTINSGSGNFTVSHITTGWYAITITGEAYQFQSYTCTVTPVGSSVPVITGTGSGSNNLHVYTYNASGVAVDNQFSFVVYKQ